jgi:DNA-binding response OmpR family regulator
MSDAKDPARLLIVEDEEHLATGLRLNLELEGYAVEHAATAREARELLVNPSGYAAIILDIMLPDLDGFELCRHLRRAGNLTPVIMLTARASADDRVRGLDAGADDYLVKPFQLSELLARVRSVLRRSDWDRGRERSQLGTNVLDFGDAHIDFDTHEATVRGNAVQLTQLEIDLVRYFAANAGRVLSRDELLEHVWKLRNYPNTRTVDNFIVRLRRIFEADPAEPVHFLSVRGSGYRFVTEPLQKLTKA